MSEYNEGRGEPHVTVDPIHNTSNIRTFNKSTTFFYDLLSVTLL